jgi:hypothetical protein
MLFVLLIPFSLGSGAVCVELQPDRRFRVRALEKGPDRRALATQLQGTHTHTRTYTHTHTHTEITTTSRFQSIYLDTHTITHTHIQIQTHMRPHRPTTSCCCGSASGDYYIFNYFCSALVGNA